MDSDGARFPSGRHDNCVVFPEEHVSKRAVRSLSVSIRIYDAIYLYAISFCHFTVGSVGALRG